MGSLGEAVGKDLFPTPLDPVMIELNRLENTLRDKERELGVAHSEIKALKVTELLKDRAVVELSNELKTLEEKLRTAEKHLEYKNLEIKKIVNEKKEALAAQFAAEATLRRIYTSQKDEDPIPVEVIIAPLEADIKLHKNEIARLREDNKALERLTKLKELALIEAEKILQSALERALIVETVQNQNLELKRQIEICQEENRILEKTIRQKVVEVEKLTQTILELEESILAGGAVANAVRDYQRQVSELNEEKKALERQLARAKVSANRVATVVANEWKDDNDKVMPVKQWLEERRYLQGEMQRLRDKLATSERTAKAEAQLKDKLRLRLKTLEEGLKNGSGLSIKQTGNLDPAFGFLSNNGEPKMRSLSQPRASRSASKFSTLSNKQTESSDQVNGLSSHNGGPKKRSSSQPRASLCVNKNSVLQQPKSQSEGANSTINIKPADSLKMRHNTGENLVKKNLWAPRSKFFDDRGKENNEGKINSNRHANDGAPGEEAVSEEAEANGCSEVEVQSNGNSEDKREDMVSGLLYDRLQTEVVGLRKLHEEKDGLLNSKDDEIKTLLRKIETLMKAMEVESKKIKREAAAKEKEALSFKSEDSKQKPRSTSVSRRGAKHLETSPNSRS